MRDAEAVLEERDFKTAHSLFKDALGEVPEPVDNYAEATRATVGIADCYYFLKQFELAEKPLNDVLLLPGGGANPYVRLRRGQVFHHLGDPSAAQDEWVCAFLNGGRDVFRDETDCQDAIRDLLAELEGEDGGLSMPNS